MNLNDSDLPLILSSFKLDVTTKILSNFNIDGALIDSNNL